MFEKEKKINIILQGPLILVRPILYRIAYCIETNKPTQKSELAKPFIHASGKTKVVSSRVSSSSECVYSRACCELLVTTHPVDKRQPSLS